MVIDLMLESKMNQVSVIICKTLETQHHKIAAGCDIEMENELNGTNHSHLPFPNFTELTDGLQRPTIDMLRRLQKVKTIPEDRIKSCSSKQNSNDEGDHPDTIVGGGIIDGVILAADALYERTTDKNGKFLKFQRRIVLLTDAEYNFEMDQKETAIVIDALRDMEARLYVVGIDFETSSVYTEPLKPQSSSSTANMESTTLSNKPDSNQQAASGDNDAGEHSDSETEDDNDDDDVKDYYDSKELKEELLHRLAEMVGGKVVAAHTLEQILEFDKGRKIKRAVASRFQLWIAPGLAIEARSLRLMASDNPRLERSIAFVDEEARASQSICDGNQDVDQSRSSAFVPLKDPNTGKELLDSIKQTVRYYDEKDPDVMVCEEDRTTAIRYGADLIPMNKIDYEGLKLANRSGNTSPAPSAPKIEILGYMLERKIPTEYRIGPPYAISGHLSRRACTLIASLAQALEKTKKAAICTYTKTKRSKPILGALFPLPGVNPEIDTTAHLVFLQIPYAGEVNSLNVDELELFLEDGQGAINIDTENESNDLATGQAAACDSLIDALMLPDNILTSGTVPSPYLRSWHQSVIARAFDPDAALITVRSPPNVEEIKGGTKSHIDPMTPPSEILNQAQPALKQFHSAFPLNKSETAKKEEKIRTEKNASPTGIRRKKASGNRVLTYSDYL